MMLGRQKLTVFQSPLRLPGFAEVGSATPQLRKGLSRTCSTDSVFIPNYALFVFPRYGPTEPSRGVRGYSSTPHQSKPRRLTMAASKTRPTVASLSKVIDEQNGRIEALCNRIEALESERKVTVEVVNANSNSKERGADNLSDRQRAVLDDIESKLVSPQLESLQTQREKLAANPDPNIRAINEWVGQWIAFARNLPPAAPASPEEPASTNDVDTDVPF